MASRRSSFFPSFLLITFLAEIFSLGIPVPVAGAQEKVTLATGEWKPFISEEQPDLGPLSEIVRRAFKRVNIETEYVFVPWKRAYVDAERGEYDGSPAWGFTEERADKFFYSDAILIQEDYVFYKKSKPLNARTIGHLAGLKYGKIRGGLIRKEFRPYFNQGDANVIENNSYEGLFKMLIAGRIDFIPLGKFIGIQTIRNSLLQEEKDQVAYLDNLIRPLSYYLIIPKVKENGHELITAFNKGLAALKESGDYDRILDTVYAR